MRRKANRERNHSLIKFSHLVLACCGWFVCIFVISAIFGWGFTFNRENAPRWNWYTNSGRHVGGGGVGVEWSENRIQFDCVVKQETNQIEKSSTIDTETSKNGKVEEKSSKLIPACLMFPFASQLKRREDYNIKLRIFFLFLLFLRNSEQSSGQASIVKISNYKCLTSRPCENSRIPYWNKQ